MEDPNLESYWRDKEQKKKAAFKDRFDFKKIILAGCTTYIGVAWHKKIEYDDDTTVLLDTKTIKNGYEYIHKPNYLIIVPSILFTCYEFGNGLFGLFQRTFGKSFPLKNQISHYQIKYQVENYNRLKINTKISE